MQNAKWIITLLLLALGLYLILMEQAPKDSSQESSNPESTIQKRFDAQNRLKSDATVVNGKREGVAHNYYEDGTIHSEINYENDIKHGTSTWFYPDGQPYRITPFVHGKKMGVQKKYYKSGKIMAEIPYQNDTLIPGTKEYAETGQLKEDPISFTIRANRDKNQSGLIRIEIAGKKVNRIEYIQVYPDMEPAHAIKLKPGNDQNPLLFYLKSSTYIQKSFNCWVIYKTEWNNHKIKDFEVHLN